MGAVLTRVGTITRDIIVEVMLANQESWKEVARYVVLVLSRRESDERSIPDVP